MGEPGQQMSLDDRGVTDDGRDARRAINDTLQVAETLGRSALREADHRAGITDFAGARPAVVEALERRPGLAEPPSAGLRTYRPAGRPARNSVRASQLRLQASGGAELRERLLVPAPADAEFTLGPGQVPALGHGLGDPVTGGQRVGVVGTQNPQPGGQYVAVLGLGRGVIAAGGGGSGDTVPGIQSVGVIRAQHALPSAPAATSPPTRCPAARSAPADGPHNHQSHAPAGDLPPASLGDHHQPRQPPRQAHPARQT